MMRIIIYIDSDTGEIFYYVPDESGEAFFIEPRVKKKEGKPKEDEERFH